MSRILDSFLRLLSRKSQRRQLANLKAVFSRPPEEVSDEEVTEAIKSVPLHRSQISSMFGNLPGIGGIVETYEAAITFGINYQLKWWNGQISASAIDTGNNPTWRLRPGLILGQITATGLWTNYSATATDGSEVATAILAYGLRMQDVLTGSNTQKFYAIVIGGNVQAGNLIGLDQMARAQLAERFTFDDNLRGNQWFPFPRFQTKVANYTIVAADNFTLFNNVGATGEVDFTLPTILNGYYFGFRNYVAQTLKVISAEGSNIVAKANASASSLAFSTGGAQIGAGLVIYSNPAATKWESENISADACAITVA